MSALFLLPAKRFIDGLARAMMEYSTSSTDRFKLDSLPKPNDTSRPTIPFSQFLRPPLLSVSISDASSNAWSDEDSPNVNRSTSSATPKSIDLMSPLSPQGHRRRRSTLMNGFETSIQPRGGGSARRTLGKHEDQKRLDEDGDAVRRSGDDPLSASGELELEGLLEEGHLDDDEETGLTGQERTRRKNQKRRNTLIDERIAASSKVAEEESKEVKQAIAHKAAINGGLIGLWYLFSLSLSLYNTWMFSDKHLKFPFPLFTTSMHMLVQFSLASLVLYFMPRFRPRYNSISNEENIYLTDADQERHEIDQKRPLMTKWFYFTRLGPCGTATGLDIGLGNMSLKTISLSFYTMCKSSSLAFVLMFAFLFRLESLSWRLISIIVTMIVGVIMMVFGELKFEKVGFILVISAAFFSGFRWGLTQILLLRNPATSNPFSSIFYLAPIMFFTLIFLAIPVEGFSPLYSAYENLSNEKGALVAPLILLFPGVLAFLMTASEFALLKRTSVVTLSIAGIFKEVVTITAAGLIFKDRLTSINISGLFITIGAIAAYNYIKITKMRDDTLKSIHSGYGLVEQVRGEELVGSEEEDWEMQEQPDDRIGFESGGRRKGGFDRNGAGDDGEAPTTVADEDRN